MKIANGACEQRNSKIVNTFKSTSTLIVATCQDVNIQIYPLAWGIVDYENNASWTWFFMKLKEVMGDTKDLVVISDRHPSIINGVRAIYKNARHGRCIYHIKGNLSIVTRKTEIFLLFKKAAEAYTLEEFGNYMSKIERIDIKAWDYLVKICFHAWAKLHFQGNRYNIMTSNNAKSLNLSYTSTLTLIIEEKLRKNVDKSKNFVAKTYEVRKDAMNFAVNLDKKTCSCRRFQLEHLPCEHAITAVKKSGYSIYLFCSLYYTVEYWKCNDEVGVLKQQEFYLLESFPKDTNVVDVPQLDITG
ncbi:uncharacterized protein LOC111394290 [Olea europaea var. sylvestris]|uniref:uncharacterized protein LOC111394290 n=1 Tax=Olea europaea var. sylvestris TaxID=158386 RepID=UPI000C1D3CF0|nr:uncharacterized protein LOC111394290 [Olea europaea var. sylvestris]